MLTSSIGLGVNNSNSYFIISGGLTTRKFLSINSSSVDVNTLGLVFNAQTNLNFSGTTSITFPSGTSTAITTNNIANNILPITLSALKIGINNASPSATLDITQGVGNTSSTSLLIKLTSSQTANAFDIRDSTNNLLFNIDSSGIITSSGYKSQDGTSGITATQNGLVFKNGLYTSGTSTAITSLLPITLDNVNKKIGINNTTPSATLDIVQGAGNTTSISLLIKQISSQTSNSFEIRNSANNTIFNIDSGGIITPSGYKSSDGTSGATATTGGVTFKNGLYTSGTISATPPQIENTILWSGFTPLSTGADQSVFILPYSLIDGTTSLTWTPKRLTIRSENQNGSGGNTTLNIEYYAGTGAFSSAGNINTSALSLGQSANESSTNSFTGTYSSGNKFRINLSSLNPNHGPFVITMLWSGI